jgi:hypothetical protein
MTSEVSRLKGLIAEAQRRLAFAQGQMQPADEPMLRKWQEAYARTLGRMEGLCSRLQELAGWENTCLWGCHACLTWGQPPLQVFQEQGYLLLWSAVLQDRIAFAKDWAVERVPDGFTVYREGELRNLFSGEGRHRVSPGALRLIHEAKKRAGAVVREVTPTGDEKGDSRG